MKYIGVHIGHDATIVALDSTGNVIFYGQCERYSRFTNHGFELDPIGIAFPNIPYPEEDDVVAIVAIDQPAHPKWRNVINVSDQTFDYPIALARPYKPRHADNFFAKSIGRNPDLWVSHHLAHAISSWCFRENDDERLFLAYDGAGFDANLELIACLVGYIGPNGFSHIENAVPIPSSLPLVGMLGYHSAGKAMGLAGYMPKEDWSDEMTMKLITASFNELKEPQYPFIKNEDLNDKNLQFIANFYRWYTTQIWYALKANIDQFAAGKGVVLGGGTALALELNTKIHDCVKDVVFGPPIDDSGLALGAAAFAYFHVNKTWIKIGTPSLNDLQDPLPAVGPQEPADIAKALAARSVVGLLRGKSEAGPRALGFRSILASCDEENLKRVSQDIKGREFYRPLAPMVTEEQFDRFFLGPKGKYMQYRCMCTQEAREMLPAICHKDGSARPQVVSKEDDPWLHELLVRYGELNGAECLINTSLNKAKKPICNTYEDARRELRGKEIELVSIAHDAWKPPAKKLLMI